MIAGVILDRQRAAGRPKRHRGGAGTRRPAMTPRPRAARRRPAARRLAERLGGVLLAAFVAAAGCGGPAPFVTWTDVEERIREAFPGAPSLDTAALAALMRDPARPLVLLDVREPDEFAVSHLRGAVRVTSPDHAAALVRSAPEGATVVVYCSVGYRSARLVADLRGQGLANVHNLEGSIFRWANEDRPLFRGDAPVRRVHPFDETWGVLLAAERRAFSP